MFDHINHSLATIRHFRPAWKDRYSLDPLWEEQRVTDFENQHLCRLPEDYRNFLLLCGSGGPGPNDVLFAPDQHFTGSGHEECLGDDPDLSLAFPHTEAWNDSPPNASDGAEAEEDWQADYFSSRHSSGSLIISDQGCGLWIRLIITGPLAGEIWLDDRADGDGLRPLFDADGNRVHFLKWHTDWLEAEVHRYGHAGTPR